MRKASLLGTSPKVSSISRRFSYALIGVVTLLLITFTTVVILLGINKIIYNNVVQIP
ncbi:hypothetical protein ES703_82666 [subsurface metagenome]